MSFQIRLRNGSLANFSRPAVMGILNVSPNSFFNPCFTKDKAIDRAAKLVAEGADIIDIGGEATNPNVEIEQERPNFSEESDRVLPVVELIRQRFEVLISVDTRRALLMRSAVELGADMINDQCALQEDKALETVSELKVPVCLMHFLKKSKKKLSLPALLLKIKTELCNRVEACLEAGISQERLILDPGFGGGNYAKSCEENFHLLNNLYEFVKLGYPVLSGWSRKSMLGEVLGGRPKEERLYASVAADTLAAYLGASIIRTHDVAATKDAVFVAAKLKQGVSPHG